MYVVAGTELAKRSAESLTRGYHFQIRGGLVAGSGNVIADERAAAAKTDNSFVAEVRVRYDFSHVATFHDSRSLRIKFREGENRPSWWLGLCLHRIPAGEKDRPVSK